MTRIETWCVESWDDHNREEGHYLGAAGWVPAGHVLRSEAEARAWAEHLEPVAAPLRIVHRIVDDEVIDL